MSEELFTCDVCGDEEAGQVTTTVDGDTCDSCVDNYMACDDCGDLVEDINSVEGGNKHVCEDCVSNYYMCEDCEEYVDANDTSTVGWDRTVCDRCISNNYGFCEECDEYYHHDDSYEHEHNDQCDCSSEQTTFRVRNGDGFLDNDETTVVSLPSGFVSDEGIGAIARAITDHMSTVIGDIATFDTRPNARTAYFEERPKWMALAYSIVDGIGQEWQTKEGNFTKRLSRYAYKSQGLKIPAALLTQIGNLGSQHSQGADLTLAFTRDLNLAAEEFAHPESCWWQSYYTSRCSLKTNGGMGLRTFGTRKTWSGAEYQTVTGRAWVMPLRHTDDGFVPTYNTETPDAVMVFNGYGDLGGYAPARIVAQMNGMTYRKVNFYNDPMYVNSDQGYLVGPEDLVKPYTDGKVTLYTDEHANVYNDDRRNDRLPVREEVSV